MHKFNYLEKIINVYVKSSTTKNIVQIQTLKNDNYI
jgi:hypothetical protein